ncbi:hypothetical protein M0811_04097 [Anaeramoeba ignava]|uniref:Uncharacterized protein n=1 Tax=Anaeramoeba ignava TaxID=1746090 RepID=A0A9Q0RIH3_ANAIG|nr:hypothetical protein M0811_04097 [Anaeramoeba ignava]
MQNNRKNLHFIRVNKNIILPLILIIEKMDNFSEKMFQELLIALKEIIQNSEYFTIKKGGIQKPIENIPEKPFVCQTENFRFVYQFQQRKENWQILRKIPNKIQKENSDKKWHSYRILNFIMKVRIESNENSFPFIIHSAVTDQNLKIISYLRTEKQIEKN